MRAHYADILSRIAESPKWFDEHGVPRWCEFAPGEVANIYAAEAALVLVTCQGCDAEFRVAMSWHRRSWSDTRTLSERIRLREAEYMDPPNTGCCPAGPTMLSEPRRVIEFWHRTGPRLTGWARSAALEINIRPDWVIESDLERGRGMEYG